MWNSKKKLSLLLVVLLVASFSLSAFSFWGGSSEEKQPITVQEDPVQEVSVEPVPVVVEEAVPVEVSEEPQPVTPSETEQQKESEELSKLLQNLETTSRMNKDQVEELVTTLELVRDDYAIVMADAEEKQAIIDELADENAALADQVAYMKGRYDKAISTRFFTNAGLAIGFKNNLPTWGAVANFGARFGNGMTISAGAQYMVGNFVPPVFNSWALDNLSVNFTVGYEF